MLVLYKSVTSYIQYNNFVIPALQDKFRIYIQC